MRAPSMNDHTAFLVLNGGTLGCTILQQSCLSELGMVVINRGLYTEPPILMDSTRSLGILHWSPTGVHQESTRSPQESTRSLLRISSGLTQSPGGLHPDSTWSPSGIGRNTRSPPGPDFQSFPESIWTVRVDSVRTPQDIY